MSSMLGFFNAGTSSLQAGELSTAVSLLRQATEARAQTTWSRRRGKTSASRFDALGRMSRRSLPSSRR